MQRGRVGRAIAADADAAVKAEAAVKIQAIQRGRADRMAMKEEDDAAIKIQELIKLTN